MKALTITANSVVLVFDDQDKRDKILAAYQAATPRETHSRAKVTSKGDDEHTLTIRLQDITHPVTIPITGHASAAVSTDIPTGEPTYNRLKELDRDSVPGANADARTEERETTSGFNLTQGVPGAVNNDPSTATNAAYEGSPAQAFQSLAGEGLGARLQPTPGGFAGPDKAARVKGADGGGALSPLPGPTAESLHPEGQEQDTVAVDVSREAVETEKEAKEAAKAGDGGPVTEQDGVRVNPSSGTENTATDSEGFSPEEEGQITSLANDNNKETLMGMAREAGVSLDPEKVTKKDIARRLVTERRSKGL